jgi:hypothetical protein
MGSLSLTLRVKLDLECFICLASLTGDPDFEGALFGAASIEELIAKNICPCCHNELERPWTDAEQNRIAKWIMLQIENEQNARKHKNANR